MNAETLQALKAEKARLAAEGEAQLGLANMLDSEGKHREADSAYAAGERLLARAAQIAEKIRAGGAR